MRLTPRPPPLSRRAALLALVALAACGAPSIPASSAPAAPRAASAEPIVIHDNGGGNVVQMISRRAELEASGRPVRISGKCNSACTMLITLPNACLDPDARVGFHAPRLPGTRIIPPIVDQLMAMHYRGGILERWNGEWRHSLKMQRISALEYVRLDPQTRLCPG